ncbi:MAG TPA: ATP synthase F0 subunit C [Candidatus Binatia bacterium]|nr:ATP synthase F0 subunit C [Candidatus Binatia bacterium]
MKRIKTFLTLAAGAVLSSPLLATMAQAQDHDDAAAVAAAVGAGASGMMAMGAGIAIAGAAFGCALGQGRAVASAMESIGRNPNSADRIQTPMIIGLAMIEALAIYALVIAFLLQGKI